MINFFKKYYKIIFILIVLIFIIIINIVVFNKNDNIKQVEKIVPVDKNIIEEKVDDNKELVIEEKKTVFVDVKGAVNKPGVYELDEGKRVIDAINLAGGLINKSDTINLNLSKKLNDEMIIIVYTKEELYNYKKSNDVSKKNINCASIECVCPDVNNDACIKKEDTKKEIINKKVSLNNASKDELMTLSGVGESKADAIIKYRTEKKFKTIEELKEVTGFGDAVFNKIKDNIEL